MFSAPSGRSGVDGKNFVGKTSGFASSLCIPIIWTKTKEAKINIIHCAYSTYARLFATGIENSSTYLVVVVGTDFLCENGNRLERSRSCVTI